MCPTTNVHPSADGVAKRKLTRLERDIVWQLEETGSENVAVVLNSLSNRGEHYPTRAHVLPDFLAAVKHLLAIKRVIIVMGSMRHPFVGADTLEALGSGDAFAWDSDAACWKAKPALLAVELAEGPNRG